MRRIYNTAAEAPDGLLKSRSLPLTGKGVVDRNIPNLGVLDMMPGGLRIAECAEGVTGGDLRAATEASSVA